MTNTVFEPAKPGNHVVAALLGLVALGPGWIAVDMFNLLQGNDRYLALIPFGVAIGIIYLSQRLSWMGRIGTCRLVVDGDVLTLTHLDGKQREVVFAWDDIAALHLTSALSRQIIITFTDAAAVAKGLLQPTTRTKGLLVRPKGRERIYAHAFCAPPATVIGFLCDGLTSRGKTLIKTRRKRVLATETVWTVTHATAR